MEFPILGIGASAGGLEAFENFFKAMPVDSGLACVVISHLDPKHVSLLPELLQRATKIPVEQVIDGVLVKPNTIYVIPPNKELHILHGKLQLMELKQRHGFNRPIDVFFRSLAEDQKTNAVGIILSGTGSDGSLGLRAIKDELGMVMAQDLKTAKYDGMPRNAIATNLVDYVLPANQMPEQLIHYCKTLHQIKAPLLQPSQKTTLNELQKIFIILRSQTNHDFSLYKLNTIIRRIERRMNLHGLTELTAYVQYLRENETEVDILYKELLIGVTNFFRDPNAFDSLKTMLPELLKNKPEGETLRVWVAGCSSGEEAYSIAILLSESLQETLHHCLVQIFATDIDEDAITKARNAVYPASILEHMSVERLSRHFSEEPDGQYRVKKSIREMLVFAHHNINRDPPFTKLDLMCCRNLLIYFGAELQSKLIPMFHYSLNTDGLLFLGSSESIGQNTNRFETADKKWKIFRSIKIDSNAQLPYKIPIPPLSMTSTDPKPDKKTIKPADEVDLLRLVENILHENHAPPSAIIDAACNILYIHGRTGRFLEPPEGKTSTNILEMARVGIKQPLTTAIQKASAYKKAFKLNNLSFESNSETITFELLVKPIIDEGVISNKMLVIFQESTTPQTTPVLMSLQSDLKQHKSVAALEQELLHNQENLQTTIEQLETSNEELKSTNEELQSTNEEMETSKEELQSLNEESVTVNAELQSRIDQLSKANDDMKNLLNSTDIATIFLDIELCIQRFTPKATNIIPLVGIDTGRPIKHFASNLIGTDLTDYAQQVLDTLACKQVEVQSRDGHSYQMRVLPYRTVNNVINGVVITFDDITERKLQELNLEESKERYRMLIQDWPYCIHEIDLEGRFLSINNAGLRMMKVESENQVIGMSYLDVVNQVDTTRIAQVLKMAYQGQFQEFEFKGNNGQHYLSSFVPVTNAEHTIISLMGLTQDITKRKQEDRIQIDILNRILDTTADLLSIKDAQSVYLFANQTFCRFLNKTEQEIVGKNDIELFPLREAEKFLTIETRQLKDGHEHSVIEDISGAQGIQRFHVNRIPILDETSQQHTKILVTMSRVHEE